MNPIVIATDLTESSEPALRRGFLHARAVSAPVVVCHVVPEISRHPLAPAPGEDSLSATAELTRRAAELVTRQVEQVTGASGDDYRVVVESGDAEDRIVELAEAEHASLVVIGARPRSGAERVLGVVAERVVRYAHAPVLVARSGPQTGRMLVATDFEDASRPALAFMKGVVDALGLEATLLHVMQVQSSVLPSVLAPLGIEYAPPAKAAMDDLAELGRKTLAGLAAEYGARHAEQVDGNPADVIVARAAALEAELVVMGSRGRKGLRRLFLGSVAEAVIRRSSTSVLVAR